MKRRDLLKSLIAFPALAQPLFGESNPKPAPKKRIIKPKRLRKSATIGLISPAGSLDGEDLEKSVRNLTDFGFKVKVGKNAAKTNGYLAGTDRERLADLHWAFADREIDAIWCSRGGYGASRLLPFVDFNLIKRNPKILIGYSDITALHLAIYEKCGLVSFHGPVAASTFSPYSQKHCLELLMNPLKPYTVELAQYNLPVPPSAPTEPPNQETETSETRDTISLREANLYKTEIITGGICRGRIVGGNLTLLATLAGTPFALKDIKDKILFIEDVNEQPYRIDRMLTQIRQSVDLRKAAGIALGVFKGCNPRGDAPTQSLLDVLRDHLGSLGIPVIYGLSFGHIRDQFTIPLGITAQLDTEKATVTFLETSVF